MNTEQELQQISALLGDTGAETGDKNADDKSAAPTNPQTSATAPVAIIGVAAKLPGCDSANAFWQALANDEELLSEFPADRFNWEDAVSQYDADLADDAPQYGGIINGVFDFDAEFFAVSEDAAPLIDPRQRLLLQNIYHCFEDAGYGPQSLKRSATGVFIGAEDSEYQITLQQNGIFPDVTATSAMLANNIAYWFDFCGASEVVNTLCSSGAVALHRAVNALRSGELQQAVVAGVNLLLRAESYVGLTQMGQLSQSRAIHSFGEQADGFIRSEGVVSVLLKPLAQAEQDGDNIYALIKNTAVNFNGQGGMSMASPNVAAHVEVIKQCYQQANIDIQQLDYIEAQGMGTTVSDIAEWSAFNKAMRQLANAQNVTLNSGQVAISTLKPTLGHMHAASSLGALLKVIGSLRSGKLYGIAHFSKASPDLDLEDVPCRLLSQTEAWPEHSRSEQGGSQRLAAVHSYGIGGNNAHVLLEEYSASDMSPTPDLNNPDLNSPDLNSNQSPRFLPVSAPTEAQLRLCLNQLAEHLTSAPLSLGSLERTLKQGRDSFTHRVLLVVPANIGSGVTSLAKAINNYLVQGYQSGDAQQGSAGAFNGAFVADDGQQLNQSPTAVSATEWLSGKAVNWQLSDTVNAAPLCRLPLFPFSTQSYRISENPQTGRSSQDSEPEDKPVRFADILAEPHRSRAEAVTIYIQQFLSRSMHSNSPIAPDTPFVDSGVDSLIMVRLVRAIEKEMQVKLSGRDFMQCADIASLSALIHSRMGEEAQPVPQNSLSASADLDLEALNKFKSGEMSLDDIKKLV